MPERCHLFFLTVLMVLRDVFIQVVKYNIAESLDVFLFVCIYLILTQSH